MSAEPETIIAEIADLTGIPVAAITGCRRTTQIVHARTLAMAAVRQAKAWWPLVDIAAVFQTDRSTVTHALRRHERYLEGISGYRENAAELNRRLVATA